MIEWLSNEKFFSDRLNDKGRSKGLPHIIAAKLLFNYIPLKRQTFRGVAQSWGIGASEIFNISYFTCMAGAISPFIEHDQVVANYFGGKLSVAILVFPATGSKPALNINEAAFMQVLLSQFSKASPEHYSMPFGLRNQLAGSVLKRFRSSEGKFCNTNIAFKKLYIGVFTKIANEHYSVYTSHTIIFYQVK